jgi:hypothetical protein
MPGFWTCHRAGTCWDRGERDESTVVSGLDIRTADGTWRCVDLAFTRFKKRGDGFGHLRVVDLVGAETLVGCKPRTQQQPANENHRLYLKPHPSRKQTHGEIFKVTKQGENTYMHAYIRVP